MSWTRFLLGLALLGLPATAAAQDTDEGERILARLEYERLRTYSGRGVDISARMRIARERVMALRRIAPQGVPGARWRPLGPTQIDDPRRGQVAGRVSTIAIHPRNPAVVYIGAAQGGVWKTENRGASWTPLSDHECSLAMGSIAIDPGVVTDLVMHPVDPSILYAANRRDGVYKSTDGGRRWDRASGGMRDTDIGRINLAIAPSAPDVLYAAIRDLGEDAGRDGGPLVYRTDDGAATWREVDAKGASCNGICWYALTLAVHPLNPDRLNLGAGVRLFLSEDGGQTFDRAHPDNVYVDQHHLVFDTLSGPDVVYLANDGGVHRSMDAGISWTSLATNLAIAQFYPGITPHPVHPVETLGGTQDQGTLRASAGTTTWTKVLGGDGGFTAIDAEDPDVWYGEAQWPYGPRKNGRYVQSGIDRNDRAAFIPPLVMDPVDSRRLYFGTQSVYRTENSANNWVRI